MACSNNSLKAIKIDTKMELIGKKRPQCVHPVPTTWVAPTGCSARTNGADPSATLWTGPATEAGQAAIILLVLYVA